MEFDSEVEKLVSGTLSDKNILELCGQNILISEEFQKANIKQACYELRASNVYWDLSDDNHSKRELNSEEYILIKPKQHLVIITQETLYLPNNILGRILTKGKLFSIGLLPINTYADPGFEGKLGIVFFNLSNNYLKIMPGEAIAKVEFAKLQNPVFKPYNGQHGYQTNIWPIPSNMILTEEEILKDKRIKSVPEEIELAYGKHFASAIKNVFGFGKYLVFATIAYITFSMLLISFFLYKGGTTDAIISPLWAILSGVFSNAIFALVTYIATSRLRR